MSDERDWDPATIDDVECLDVTAGGALKCRVDGKLIFIPKKLVDDDSEVYGKGHKGKLVIPTWLAVEKELV